MDRRDNSSRLLSSNLKFVNNHFWNCFERDHVIVVDTIPATSEYLDTWLVSRLESGAPVGGFPFLFSNPQCCGFVCNHDSFIYVSKKLKWPTRLIPMVLCAIVWKRPDAAPTFLSLVLFHLL
jgi:hypothetical protein